MKVSAGGRRQLTAREGRRLKAYKDSKGIWTIGVGHTAAAGAPHPVPGMVITAEQCDQILARDLTDVENAVIASLHRPVNQGQFDAICSLVFNIGIGGWRRSTVLKRINAGRYKEAGEAFLMWNKPPEIMNRRRSERKQFLTATAAKLAVDDESRDNSITVADLRNAGSRTVEGTDEVRAGVVGTAVSSVTAVGAVASQIGEATSSVADVASHVSTVTTTVSTSQMMVGWLQHNWHWIAIAVLTSACIYFMWRAWHGANKVIRARISDAETDAHDYVLGAHDDHEPEEDYSPETDDGDSSEMAEFA